MNEYKAEPRSVFETAHLNPQLRRHGVRGAAATVFSQAARFAVQLGGTMVLARLLLPSEFGVVGKTIAITGFITLIRTGGLSLATIQREEVTHRQISTLFWLNVLLGLAAAAIVSGISPLMAWFYSDPRVLDIGLALAGLVALNGLSVQHSALLQRQMRFRELATTNVMAMVVGVLSAVLAAWWGASYWSLVIQQYAYSLTLLVLLANACRWWPGAPGRGSDISPLVRLGANQTGFNVLNFASRNVDNVLIGRFVSDAALGFYSQAYSLLMLPIAQLNAPISAVAVSTLSKLQNQPRRYARFYYRALGLIVFFGMPLVCFLLIDAPMVVRLLLGAKWLPIVPIFRALGVAAFFGTFNFAGGWIYSSLGRTERRLRWQILVTAVTLSAFLVGVRWGVVGVAVSFSAIQPLLLIPSLHYCYKGTPIRVAMTLAALARPAAAALAATLVLALMHLWWYPTAIAWVMLDAPLFAASYLLAWGATRHGRHYLRSFGELLVELKGAR